MNRLWKERLDRLRADHLTRQMRVLRGPVGPVVSTPDGEKILFCSNDYLGLANDPAIKGAVGRSAERWGAGVGASRLICGNTDAHQRLEQALAEFMGTQEAVLFPSGYQANVGALTALTQAGDVIFSDQLAHASLVDGCRLSRADVRVFRHLDTDHLAELLSAESGEGLKLIVTDAVFSMDGDLARLAEIAALAETHGANVYVDEAHGLGVFGPEGEGLCASIGVAQRVGARLGTLGKALGVSGGFVACGRDAAGLLRSRARSLLYTTGAPAVLAEAAMASLQLVRRAHDRRASLNQNIACFKQLAEERALPVLASDTAIQPVVVGAADRTMAISDLLWRRGLFVQGIRPPTVAEGTSRLRVSLTASHTEEQIQILVQALHRAFEETDHR